MPPTLSIVLATRDDEWGAAEKGVKINWGMRRRAGVSLSRMLEVVDEVVLVDFNSPKVPLLASLPDSVQRNPRLKSIVVTAAECAELRGQSCGDAFLETLARNIGLSRATSDVIASSSIDVLPPPRPVLDALIAAMPPHHAYVLRRRDDLTWHSRSLTAPCSNITATTSVEIGFTRPTTKDHGHSRLSQAQSRLAQAYNDGQDKLAVADHSNACALRSLRAEHVVPWEGSVSLANISLRPTMTRTRALLELSLIDNVGDFQLAARGLWARTGFSEALAGRNYADTTLVSATDP